MVISPHPPRRLSVSTFLDGTARMIEPPVLKTHKAFQEADRRADADVALIGKRHSVGRQRRIAGAYFAGAAGIAALGAAAESVFGHGIGLCLGLGALPAAFVGGRHLQTSFTAPEFQPTTPSAEGRHAAEWSQALAGQRAENSEAFQVAYLSGHGSHKKIAGFAPQTLGRTFRSTPVDLTVLDACNTGQLEVLSQLGPGAGQVLTSVHPVPSKGFPVEEILQPRTDQGRHAFHQAKDSTPSLTLVDNRKLHQDLLPALDRLGGHLAEAVAGDRRREVVRALGEARGADMVFTPRVDVRSFLQALTDQEWDETTEEAITAARESLEQTVLEDTGWSVSFRLDGKQSQALPRGWNSFVQELGLCLKPWDILT